MPRQPRLVLPGVSLHVIQRGNNKAACFLADNDYLCYLTHLHEISERHQVRIHAYCLMTNHVHLLLTPESRGGCPNLMRDLGQRYVQYFNRQHNRTGTLWEGRFRSCIVESARYVLACQRYIELNPVRARIADQPLAYRWSSHAASLGLRADPFLSPHPDLLALAADSDGRRAAYSQLFEDVLDDEVIAEIRAATQASLPLSSPGLRAELLASGEKVAHGKSGRPSSKQADSEDQLEIGL
jgi:putative transposase